MVPLNDTDRLSVNKELIQTVQEAEYAIHKTTQVKYLGNIWESIV
jgi:hypothetical protein